MSFNPLKPFTAIFHFIIKLFSGAENIYKAIQKEWEKQQPEFKQYLIDATGVIHIIRTNLEKTPDEVIGLIVQTFPHLDLVKIEAQLKQLELEALQVINIPKTDLSQSIYDLQEHLKAYKGVELERILSQLSQTLANIFMPDKPFAMILTFLEYAFRMYSKQGKFSLK